jgi:hypothetical protein
MPSQRTQDAGTPFTIVRIVNSLSFLVLKTAKRHEESLKQFAILSHLVINGNCNYELFTTAA